MKIAYMMLAHKNFEQINLLLNALDDPDIDLYIHVDKKAENLYLNIKEKYIDKQNLFIIEDRVNVNWGGFSTVRAILNLMKEVSKKRYNYISLISGQDFPVKSVNYIKNFLIAHEGKEFIESELIGKSFWRLKCYNLFSENPNNRKLYIRLADKFIRILQMTFFRRGNFKGLKLYKGSLWFTITNECLFYILNFIENNPQYIKDYKYTFCQDESFFHIIILNSDFRRNCINDDLTYIDWENAVLGSPKILTTQDYISINSTENLFARKFDIKLDKEVLLKFEHEINVNKGRIEF